MTATGKATEESTQRCSEISACAGSILRANGFVLPSLEEMRERGSHDDTITCYEHDVSELSWKIDDSGRMLVAVIAWTSDNPCGWIAEVVEVIPDQVSERHIWDLTEFHELVTASFACGPAFPDDEGARIVWEELGNAVRDAMEC